jgi:TATA-box binding protein (TBP) (component of TFIID and TFIIIB)
MGKADWWTASILLETINYIYSTIDVPLSIVSETVTFKLDSMFCPINLYSFWHEYQDEKCVQYHYELFPALSILYWHPIHVNVFASGKVVVLGKNAHALVPQIESYLTISLILL